MAPDRLRLGFVGDVAFTKQLLSSIPNRLDGIFLDMAGAWGDCDFVIGNMEGPIVSAYPDPVRPDVEFQAPESVLAAISGTPLKVMSCAHKHILDCGPEGVKFTIERLRAGGISAFGARRSLIEANNPFIQEVIGRRIAWIPGCGLAYAQATLKRPGAADLSSRRLLMAVGNAVKDNDLVIVILHTDFEFRDYPDPARQKLSRALLEAGANAVIQHHPHIWQGVERYRHGLIAYSIGKFLFFIGSYQEKSREVRNSGLLKVDVFWDRKGTPPKLKWSVVPIRLDEKHRPVPVEDKTSALWLERLKRVSEDLSNETVEREAWRKRPGMK